MLVCNNSFGQKICKKNVCVVEFNASWNEGNSVVWLDSLENCGIVRIWIDKGDWKEKYNITDNSQFPELSRFDPVAQAIGIRPGQLCKIERPSKTAIMADFYRICSQ